jgi:alpha(1,3/1,4) fucosyltransferase
MKKIKVAYVDFWPEWVFENFICLILSKHFEIVYDNKNPDVIFHSIFGGMTQTPKYKCKKILFLGENHLPEKFGSNYSISFEPQSKTNYRLPLWQVFIMLIPALKEKLYNKVQFKEDEFRRFCSFIVSNPNNFIRNSIFTSLSTYRRVHSYGKYMTNNLELQNYSKDRYWRDAKLEYFNNVPHKFNISFENTPSRWYITEKIMDSFLCGSIPIYNGASKIGEEFNEKAFINANKLQGWDLLEKVKELDSNWDKFLEIYNEPVFTEEQKIKLETNIANFETWLIEKINE